MKKKQLTPRISYYQNKENQRESAVDSQAIKGKT